MIASRPHLRAVATAVFLCLGAMSCTQSPTTPTTLPVPTPVLGPAPVASLKVGTIDPPVLLAGQPGLFDATASSGDSLVYRIAFGDGHWIDASTASYASAPEGNRTATLTVTDRHGRTATTQVAYLVLGIDWPLFWVNSTDTGVEDFRRLHLRKSGSTITGTYVPRHTGGFKFTGRLVEDRAVELLSEDGQVRLIGSIEWRRDHPYLGRASAAILRLRFEGGPEHGTTLDFTGADPY
jgi:hypothetical protein